MNLGGIIGAVGSLFSGGAGGAGGSGNDQKILGEMKAENERNRMLNHQMQMLQNEANRISQEAAAKSNIAKSGHDARMTVANNMK